MRWSRATALAAIGMLTVSTGLALVIYKAGGLGELRSTDGGSVADNGIAGVDAQITVDTSAVGGRISPTIYGVAFADAQTLKGLGATVNRWGGNTATTYNWRNNCWNAARDWRFLNKTAEPGADAFIRRTEEAGGSPLITVPAIGWVSRDCQNSTKSVGVPGAGGGPMAPGSAAVTGYDPAKNRSSVYVPSYPRAPAGEPVNSTSVIYQDQWVRHLRDSSSRPTGARYYAIDNEPDAWAETHTDIHPVAMGYDDMVRTFEEYATAVKDQDPAGLVLGPDLCCWTTLLYSDLDRGRDNFRSHSERRAHGDQDFLPWWLQQIAIGDRRSGRRTLDLLDVHFYSQADRVSSDESDAETQARRIRSVRSLYDPTYRDESWIDTEIYLIPRLKQWIRSAYPGTGLAISEYDLGGHNDASGAVALAEALGVFGREGVDLATYWTYPSPDSPVGGAFRLYRNFDGAGATFGDWSLPATSSRDNVRVFAARHSARNEVDVVLTNESLRESQTVQVDLLGRAVEAVDQFRLVPGSGHIERAPAPGARVTLSPLGVSLLRIRSA